jgi:cation-transporting ATPase F
MPAPSSTHAHRSAQRTKADASRAWHELHVDDVARLLGVEIGSGLTAAEVRRRQETFGFNRIAPPRGTPAWVRFGRQLNQPLVYLLLAAIAVTGYLGEWVDCGVIAGVVLVNAVVGFLQEVKAGRAIDALSRMVSTEATVRRDGRKQRVASEELVPGDIVLLEPGVRVPADLRLYQVRGLQVDESALTGESVPVRKQPDAIALETVLADRLNLAFAGTIVTGGHAEGAVWATGDLTETGRIARLIADTTELVTPLTQKIARLSRVLMWVVLALTVATFAAGLWRGRPPAEMFMASVALAVGAIPEGLPAAVTIVLAIGVSRMARRRAIVRKMPAVETLGSTTVICSDKTGTLTENKMTVLEVYAGGERFELSGGGYELEGGLHRAGVAVDLGGHPALAECLRAGVLCNDALVAREGGRIEVQGDPTEAAMLVAAEKAGIVPGLMRGESPRLDAIPFESEHMFRATLHPAKGGRTIYKVGAVERLLERCVDMLDPRGERIALDEEAIRRAVAAMAARGLRVLALARRSVGEKHARLEHGHVTSGMTFLGLQGMMDPPRPEVLAAIRSCQQAGIAVKMITGDHVITARAIAGQVGLEGRREGGELVALSGRELEKITDAELPEVAARTAVFARVAPEQKLRLVLALQRLGHIVAVTGDGVNDAPALKQADIGIAMGISGTDVAKGAADMVLIDDNFATIEAAVEEGRGVFDNLTKFIVWTLPTNAGEAALLLSAILMGITLPALPVHLLWINTTTALLLGLMLVFEPKEEGLMQRPPRDPQRPLLTLALALRTGLVTLVMLAGSLWLFFWETNVSGSSIATARTAVVIVIVMVEAVYLFNCRSLHRSCLGTGFFRNRWVFVGVGAAAAAQLAFTYAPIMNRLFHTAPIGVESWIRILAVAFAVFGVVEFEKWVRFGRHRAGREVPE